jgi:hypothetical protein
MTERRQFEEHHEQLSWLDIPIKEQEIFHSAPDFNAYIDKRMFDYFNSCVDLIGYANEDRDKLLRVEVKTPMFETDAGSQAQMVELNPTNDRITYLFAQNLLIALGIETRDVLNFIDVVLVSALNYDRLFFLKNQYDISKGKRGRELVYEESPVFDPPTSWNDK